jgi:hypothetical protein
MGDLRRAESYLRPAWQLTQDGATGDHLGQVYEKQRKLPEALHMYNLALGANSGLDATRSYIHDLANIHLPEESMSAGEELSQMRTVKLPTITKESASADFCVLLAPPGKIEKASFVQGSESLRNALGGLERISIEQAFPPNSDVRLLRKGILSCSPYTGCSFVFYPVSETATAN